MTCDWDDGARPPSLRGERLWALLIAYAVTVSLCVIVNWPGRANPDSIDMLFQARNLAELNDWHSPFVTFLYGLLGPVFGYPGGALVLQALALPLWPAKVLSDIAYAAVDARIKTVVLLVWLFVFAVLIALTGQIVKDVFVVALLSVFFFTLSVCDEAGKYRGFVLAVMIALLFVFSCVRPTNIFVALLSALYVGFGLGLPKIRLLVGSLLVSVILIVSTNFANHVLLPATRTHSEITVMTFDIAGISRHVDQDLFRGLSADWPQTLESPQQCYKASQSDTFFWGVCKDYSSELFKYADRMPSYWLAQVVRHPLAYTIHRLNYTFSLLRVSGKVNKTVLPMGPDYVYTTNTAKFIEGVPQKMRGGLQLWAPTIAYAPIGALGNIWFSGVLGSPWLWLAVLVVGAVNSRKEYVREGLTVPMTATAVGLANWLSFVAFGPSDDLRYLLPTLFCALVVAANPRWLTLSQARLAALAPAFGRAQRMLVPGSR